MKRKILKNYCKDITGIISEFKFLLMISKIELR